MTERFGDRNGQLRGVATRMAAWVGFGAVVTVIALFVYGGNGARGSGPFVVVEDASSLGSGAFSGSVCFQVIRDGDGTVVSENCVDAPTTFTAPDGLEIGVLYSISISLSDSNCELLDDSRASDGSIPFMVRVSCDPAFLTATAAAQPTSTPTPLPTDTPTPLPTPTATSSPAPSPTPEPTNTPENEPTPTPVPTFDVSPTTEPETATPLPEPTSFRETSEDNEIDSDNQSPQITAPHVVNVQLTLLNGVNQAPRVRGAITISYEIARSSGAIISVLLSIGNLDTGDATILPGDVSLVSVGAPTPIGDGISIGSCIPLAERAQPVALNVAVPVISCSGDGSGGQFQQVLIIEFASEKGASVYDYAGWISLTMAIAP